MTVQEAAKRLEVTTHLVYKLCRLGRIPHRRIGVGRGAIRITEEDLAAYVESVKVGGKPQPTKVEPPRSRERRPLVPDLLGAELRRRNARRAAKFKS